MKNILKIITNPNPNLRIKSKAISLKELKTNEFQIFVNDMKDTMLEEDGVGLAAPQVDKQVCLIIVNTKNGPTAMINPVISNKSWLKVWGEEGCLSVPFTFGKVRRHKKLICNFLDEKGEKKSISAEGLMARIIQHEVDHLNGVLFIDVAKNIKSFKSTEKEQE